MRETAFGIQVPETQAEHYARAKREQAARAVELSRFYGNRQQRRHRTAGMPGTRRLLSSRERATRRTRRLMAKASRKANR